MGGKKKEFHKKEVTEEAVKDEKHLHVPLVTAERAWAYYMQLKFEANSDPRKKFHMVNRLRKAAKHAEALSAVCVDSSKVDARTKLETAAYSAWMSGTLYFETGKWVEAQKMLTQAKAVYTSLSQAVGEEEGALFNGKIQEITPSLRYCAYNIGDKQAAGDLTRDQRMDLLVAQTKEEQASSLQRWSGGAEGWLCARRKFGDSCSATKSRTLNWSVLTMRKRDAKSSSLSFSSARTPYRS